MVMIRKAIYVGDQEVQRRYIGNKLIFENLGNMEDKDKVSGTEIFTDKADDSVVHVDVDGKSYQHVGSGKNLISSNKNKLAIEIIDGIEYYKVEGTRNEADVWFEGIFSNNKQYTIRFLGLVTNFFNQVYVEYTDGTHDFKNFLDGKLDYLTTAVNKTVSTIVIDTGSSGAYGYLKVDTFQLEEGSIPTAYEPPAPTPDFPIKTHSLNDFDVVSSVGKRNLLPLESAWTNPDKEEIDLYRGYLLDLDPTKTYRITTKLKEGKEPIGGLFLYIISGTPNPNNESQIAGNVSLVNNGWLYENGMYVPMENATRESPFYVSYYPSTLDDKEIKETYEIFMEENSDDPENNWTPAPEDITEDDNHPLIDKINISLSEPLRAVGDVKDRLFRDNDGLWKVERNVHILGVEILSQEIQDKLNNLRSFKGSNYVYTIINDVSPTVAENLKPTLHATFKSKGWYDNYQ